MDYLLGSIILLLMAHSFYVSYLHKKERNSLLDRIMANNIHEFKASQQEQNIKRSESGNYLLDSMKKTLKDRRDHSDE